MNKTLKNPAIMDLFQNNYRLNDDDDGNELLKSLKAHHLTLNGRGEAEKGLAKFWNSCKTVCDDA